MVNLGNSTSLLASRLLEKVKHECMAKEEGCEEMISFPDLEKHQTVCLFREVLCPAPDCNCGLRIPFSKLEEHSMICTGISKTIHNNNFDMRISMTQTIRGSDKLLAWQSLNISAHGRKFFVRTKREKTK